MEKAEKRERSEFGKAKAKPWQSYESAYTNAKAGMDGVDKDKVQRIVYEMSKGSMYFQNEQRKEALLHHKIHNFCQRTKNLSTAHLSHYHKLAQRKIMELEATRDLSRIWLHVDMDAFYAAVETLSNPSLKGKPMAVGGMSMISTANYEARRYGVRAAMPGFIARKLCPELIFVPVDFEKYTYYSTLSRKVFQIYDPNFISASLDEAYLDITEFCRERDMKSDDVAEEIRRSVFEETGLTCSAGVGPNRLLAKVCSDINKPNGQFILPNDRMAVMTFISSLPIRKIGGIGKVTERILRSAFEIDTCKDLLEKGSILCALFPSSSSDFFLSVGLGLGSTDAPQSRLRKSMSNERTFSVTKDEAFLHQKLAELAEALATDLQKEGLCGRTLTLKLKTASFEVRTRAVTLPNWICSNEDILLHAKKLLKAELPASLRLIGLRVSQFSKEQPGRSDRMQKCITDFVIVAGTRDHNIDNSNLKAKDNPFPIEIGDCSDFCDSNDLFNSDQLFDFFPLNEEATSMDHNILPLNGKQSEMCDRLRHISEVDKPVAVQLLEAGLSRSRKSPDKVTECSSHRDDEVSSSSLLDQFQWVDDYKCSICGIELPVDFGVERLEHFDFHLAERLQEDFSDSNSMSLFSKKRHIQRDQMLSPSRKKWRKSLPKQGKYLQIDQFFSKRNQNI